MGTEVVNGHEFVEAINVEMDRPRKLRLTFGSFVKLQEVFPEEDPYLLLDRMVTFGSDGTNLGLAGVNFQGIQRLLWAALRWEDEEITLDQATAAAEAYLAKGHNFLELVGLIIQASRAGGIALAALDDEEDDPKNPEAEVAGKNDPPTSANGSTEQEETPTD